VTGEVSSLQQNIRRLDDENRSLTEKIKLASTFVASSLHFTAMNVRPEKEQEPPLPGKPTNLLPPLVYRIISTNSQTQRS
jgi:hypothetical protein